MKTPSECRKLWENQLKPLLTPEEQITIMNNILTPLYESQHNKITQDYTELYNATILEITKINEG